MSLTPGGRQTRRRIIRGNLRDLETPEEELVLRREAHAAEMVYEALHDPDCDAADPVRRLRLIGELWLSDSLPTEPYGDVTATALRRGDMIAARAENDFRMLFARRLAAALSEGGGLSAYDLLEGSAPPEDGSPALRLACLRHHGIAAVLSSLRAKYPGLICTESASPRDAFVTVAEGSADGVLFLLQTAAGASVPSVMAELYRSRLCVLRCLQVGEADGSATLFGLAASPHGKTAFLRAPRDADGLTLAFSCRCGDEAANGRTLLGALLWFGCAVDRFEWDGTRIRVRCRGSAAALRETLVYLRLFFAGLSVSGLYLSEQTNKI